MTAAIAASAALVLAAPVTSNAAPAAPASSITWNSTTDKAVAADIAATPSARTDASGPKIASNAQSADFPGVYFIWDSKQKDPGYLKVDPAVFDKYTSFVLTAKEANAYFDFLIAPQPDQKLTPDGYYTFFISNIATAKNINMVFLGGATLPPTPVDYAPENIGFIAYYAYSDGEILSTSITMQTLSKPGDCIDWAKVTQAYDDWAAIGGMLEPHQGWVSSGESIHFGDTEAICYGNVGLQQEETYQLANGIDEVFLDPGYTATPVVAAFDRYLADVNLWNDLYTGKYGTLPAIDIAYLHDEGGMDHYNALLAEFGATNLPSYWHFDWNGIDKYIDWADQLEVGLNDVLADQPQLGIDLTQYQDDFVGQVNTFIQNTNK